MRPLTYKASGEERRGEERKKGERIAKEERDKRSEKMRGELIRSIVGKNCTEGGGYGGRRGKGGGHLSFCMSHNHSSIF